MYLTCTHAQGFGGGEGGGGIDSLSIHDSVSVLLLVRAGHFGTAGRQHVDVCVCVGLYGSVMVCLPVTVSALQHVGPAAAAGGQSRAVKGRLTSQQQLLHTCSTA